METPLRPFTKIIQIINVVRGRQTLIAVTNRLKRLLAPKPFSNFPQYRTGSETEVISNQQSAEHILYGSLRRKMA